MIYRKLLWHSAIQHHVVWYVNNNVSEEHTAFTFIVEMANVLEFNAPRMEAIM
jgi:hypothetical protein